MVLIQFFVHSKRNKTIYTLCSLYRLLCGSTGTVYVKPQSDERQHSSPDSCHDHEAPMWPFHPAYRNIDVCRPLLADVPSEDDVVDKTRASTFEGLKGSLDPRDSRDTASLVGSIHFLYVGG